ncbi:MAG: EAL domain-containing protein [Actinomycetota bacterium]
MGGTDDGLSSHDPERELQRALRDGVLGVFATDERSELCDIPDSVGRVDVARAPTEHALATLASADVDIALRALREAGQTGIGTAIVPCECGPQQLTVFDLRAVHGVHVWVMQALDDVPSPLPTREPSPSARSFIARRNQLAEFITVSDEITSMLGWRPAEIIDRTTLDFLHPNDIDRSLDAWLDVLEQASISNNRCRWRCKDGSYRWVEVFNEVIDDDVIVSRIVDVQAEMDALADARLGQEGFATLTEALPIGVAQLDTDGRLIYANDALIALNEQLNAGHDLADFATISCSNATIRAAIAAALNGEGADRLVNLIAGPSTNAIQIRTRPLIVDDEPAGVIATFDDITEAKELERELHLRATIDPLTKLANRASVLEQLDAAVTLTESADVRSAVLFIDLDHFKHVNDSMGHAAGDELLVAIAKRIMSTIRGDDFVGRLGGDEFLVLCPALDSSFEARQVAVRIQQMMAKPFPIADRSIHASLSIGVAITEPGQSASDVLAAADAAAYEAKAAGRNAVQMFDQAMRHRAEERIGLISDLQRSLDKPGDICGHFQPVVDLGTGAITGFEALARWNHPTRGLLHAGAFIDLAEEVGLEVKIGWRLFEEAAAFARHCAAFDDGQEPTLVNVNMSTRQLSDRRVVERVADIIAAEAVDPRRLCIEVTERTLVPDIDAASATLSALRDLGLQTAIDDFGTGHSSLSYLRTLPFDTIKIDMSFTQTLLEGDDSIAIVGGIVRMCQAMGRKVIAEGVESQEQMAALHGLRCPYGQGYLFAPAIAPDEALDLLRSGLPHATGAFR